MHISSDKHIMSAQQINYYCTQIIVSQNFFKLSKIVAFIFRISEIWLPNLFPHFILFGS